MDNYYGGEEDYGEQQEYAENKPRLGNNLPVWGNQRTMNINNLVLTNIQASPYFKVKLYGLKTYHEVIDEIYYKIDNLEPWERGSRKTAGQTGMCGGVRGVGTGGIVSTSFCILYKLFTLKLTRKQLNGMLNHADSPYIRGLGFMYIRFCQPPKDLFDWFEPYLDDPEEIDVKAGGGCMMSVGQMCRTLLTKLEWFDTLFPRIPVPIQKMIEEKLKARMMATKWANKQVADQAEEEKAAKDRSSQPRRSTERSSSRSQSQRERSRSRSRDKKSSRRRSREKDKYRDGDKKRSKRSRSRDRSSRKQRSHSPSERSKKYRSRSRDRKRSRSRDRKQKKYKKEDRHKERSHRSR